MSATMQTRRLERAVATVVRVYRLRKLVGSILLNEAGRLLHCTPDLKEDGRRDVVVKVLFQVTRCDEESGTVPGRDGRLYSWRVVGG